MAVCSFLGHDTPLDADLYPRMLNATEAILRQHDEVDFWFCDRDIVHRIHMMAVLTARSRYPQKHITITYVTPAPFRKEHVLFPDCLIDRVVAAPYDYSEKWNRLYRWVLQQSDYLNSYVYPVFRAYIQVLHAFAKRQQHLAVCDITSPGTTAFIRESVGVQTENRLTENERGVLRKREEGCSKKEIMSQLGLTRWQMQEAFRTGQKRLYQMVQNRAGNLSASRLSLPATCGIFSLGKGSLRTATYFRHMVEWLGGFSEIKTFYLDASCAMTVEIAHLARKAESASGYHVTVVTHAPQAMENAEKERVVAQVIPPFHEVLNIDPRAQTVRAQTLRTMKEIMFRCDICLCNLSQGVFADSIRRFAPTAHTILIDIGHPSYTIVDGNQIDQI